MTEVKGVRRRTQLIGSLRNRTRYSELNEEAKDRKRDGNDCFPHENKEEIQVIFHRSMDLLIINILNN